jgi:hypothetical protein
VFLHEWPFNSALDIYWKESALIAILGLGQKTILTFQKTKTLTKSGLIFTKFCQFVGKGFCENFWQNVFAEV